MKALRKEKWIAKNLIVPASGALWHSKGDFRTDKYLIEAKSGKKETKVKKNIDEPRLKRYIVEKTTTISPKVFKIKVEDYDLLILPGGVKALEKVRQEQIVLDFISEWDKQEKIITLPAGKALPIVGPD